MLRSALAALILFGANVAHADDVLHVGTPVLDPPTLVALGIELPLITGDDNFTATVGVRYRVTGTTAWRDAMPLQHAHVEAVTGLTVSPQFAGSIIDLVPNTAYDIELHAVDADGAVDTTMMLSGHTRPVPLELAQPNVVPVTDAASLSTALAHAQPGDEILLANGTYAGVFTEMPSGTATEPIVIRGASEDGVILDAGGCNPCNGIEIYGSYVHLENLTIQNASRGMRFQTASATDNVVRYVHIKNVILGIGSQPDQANFYIADNILEGRIVWPCIYASTDPACNADPTNGNAVTPGLHANDDGIHMEGNGHVIAHNRLSGFGDAMKTQQDGVVSVDFYNNDILWSYDNALELDGSARNTRSIRNRYTNSYDPMSFQPIYGGPSYSIRDVFVNVADEEFKLHSNGNVPTVGAVILHSTVVRSNRALQVSTDISPLYFTIENSLLVGPTVLNADNHAVRWDVPGLSTATLDYNGFYPDGMYEYGYSGFGVTYPSFAALVASNTFEIHSTLVNNATLAGGLVGPTDFNPMVMPTNPTLAPGSLAIDKGVVIPNVDDGYTRRSRRLRARLRPIGEVRGRSATELAGLPASRTVDREP